MGPNLKFSAFFAGSAFVVATLTGILAGVELGVILLRALLGGALFGGFGYGAYVLISARLPELVSAGSGTAAGASAEPEGAEYGQNVDIVVDDDTEGPEGETTAAAAAEAGAAGDALAETSAEEGDEFEAASLEEVTGAEGPEASPKQPQSTETAAAEPEEVGELEEVEAAEEAEQSEEASSVETSDGDELVEEVAEVGPESHSGAGPKSEGEVDENEVDTLPDIGSFSGSFESEGTEVVEEDEQPTGGSGRAQSQGVEQDPEVIAKALQTVMKRDE